MIRASGDVSLRRSGLPKPRHSLNSTMRSPIRVYSRPFAVETPFEAVPALRPAVSQAGMPLHVAKRRAIGGAMKIRGISACLGLALLLPACRKPKEVTVDESRALTMRDEVPKLNASSNDRFQEPGTGPFIPGVVPESWLAQPPSTFRLLSYRFGTGGDVAVGMASGSLRDNINRWLGQFAQTPLLDEDIAKLEKDQVLGVKGVWVEASGDYLPGMGQPARTGQALYGFIAEDAGRIITVKMTGPAEEVAAQKPALKVFATSLRKRGE